MRQITTEPIGPLVIYRTLKFRAFFKRVGYEFRDLDNIAYMTCHFYKDEDPKMNLDTLKRAEELEFFGDGLQGHFFMSYIRENHPKTKDAKQWTALKNHIVGKRFLRTFCRRDIEAHRLHEVLGIVVVGPKRYADFWETFLECVYRDSESKTTAKELYYRLVGPYIDEIIKKGEFRDPKTILNTVISELTGKYPEYRTVESFLQKEKKGMRYVVELIVDGEVVSSGVGYDLVWAQQRAGAKFLDQWNILYTL